MIFRLWNSFVPAVLGSVLLIQSANGQEPRGPERGPDRMFETIRKMEADIRRLQSEIDAMKSRMRLADDRRDRRWPEPQRERGPERWRDGPPMRRPGFDRRPAIQRPMDHHRGPSRPGEPPPLQRRLGPPQRPAFSPPRGPRFGGPPPTDRRDMNKGQRPVTPPRGPSGFDRGGPPPMNRRGDDRPDPARGGARHLERRSNPGDWREDRRQDPPRRPPTE